MSTRKKSTTITHQHAEYADEIVAWLRVTGANPLEIGVLEEVRDRLKAHAKSGALFRVRLKNRGGTLAVASHGKAMAVLAARKERERWEGRTWTQDEIEQLETLYCRECESVERIGETLDRSAGAVREKVTKLLLKRRRPHTSGFAKDTRYKANDALAAARRIKERRVREMRREDVAAD